MTAASILLGLVPALLLVAALIAGRYPGERVLDRLRPRRRPRGLRARPVARPLAAGFTRHLNRRRGELLSCSLAGRAPPPASA